MLKYVWYKKESILENKSKIQLGAINNFLNRNHDKNDYCKEPGSERIGQEANIYTEIIAVKIPAVYGTGKK